MVSGGSIDLAGELMGRGRLGSGGPFVAEVVRVTTEFRPAGPAENSIVTIESLPDGVKRARYLSWIGYADLDDANVSEPGCWDLVEPAEPFRASLLWQPFVRGGTAADSEF